MKKDLEAKGEIVIYSPAPKGSQVEVRLEGETVWLTQIQMGELFGVDSDTVSLHLKNIYSSKELSKMATTEDSSVVRLEGKRHIKRILKYYNLDAILSVGYRVNSKKGTQFRIWANRVLKEYLLKGYVLNEEKLKKHESKIKDLQNAVNIIASIASRRELVSDEATALIKILQDYSYALDLLDQYDYGKLQISGVSKQKGFRLDYQKGMAVVETLKSKFGGSDLFGREKDGTFKSSIEVIYQTFDGKELYPSVEEKAAHLLYFVVKNYSFVDGNKRIAAFIFLWFLEKSHALYKQDGSKVLENNALVALTLMIAESRPDEKDVIAKVIVNLINKKN